MQLKKYIRLLIKKRDNYATLGNDAYYERFCIKKDENGKYKITNYYLLEKAYQKAWDNRDFEINKFWTRAAYFWGFIVLVFGAFITVLTSDDKCKAVSELSLELYLIAIGLLFSIAWYLVIKGSKCWQENWEAHIDFLEDYVSGPLYKTVYYKGQRFYSVSKINELLALLVVLVWLSLFIQYYYEHFIISFEFHLIDFQATLTLYLTLTFALAMRFGYALGGYNAEKNGFIDRFSEPPSSKKSNTVCKKTTS